MNVVQILFVLTALGGLALTARESWAVRLTTAAAVVPMAVGVALGKAGGGWAMLGLWLAALVVLVRCCGTPAARARTARWLAAQDARSAQQRARRRRTRAAMLVIDPNEAARLAGSWG